jgi:8-oxo-dGTP diphosphatase
MTARHVATLHLPVGPTRADIDGINQPARAEPVRVILDPELQTLGESQWDPFGATIRMRAAHPQVLLHELLHLIAGTAGQTETDPHGHDLVNRLEVGLAPFIFLAGTATGSTTSVPSEQQHYVAGFLIDPAIRTIALVRKGKPAWQAGLLNGIGGKIEAGENEAQAMRREFREEAGLDIAEDAWEAVAVVSGDWGSVTFFRAFGPTVGVRTMEAEPIEVHSLDRLPYDEALPNLSWLIPLALYSHDRYMPLRATEVG